MSIVISACSGFENSFLTSFFSFKIYLMLSLQISLNGLAKICCTKYAVRPNRSPGHRRFGAPEAKEDRPRSALFVNQDAIGEPLSDITNGMAPTEPYVTNTLRHSLGGAGGQTNQESFNIKIIHSHFMVLEKQLRSMETLLSEMTRTLQDRNMSREMHTSRLEWQLVAIVADKCFFYIFCLAIVLSLFFLFPNPF